MHAARLHGEQPQRSERAERCHCDSEGCAQRRAEVVDSASIDGRHSRESHCVAATEGGGNGPHADDDGDDR